MVKLCLNGSREHKHCEDIEYKGEMLIVCHDCEQTLGRKAEVYARPCGYLRPVSGFNKGKKAEVAIRKKFLAEVPKQD